MSELKVRSKKKSKDILHKMKRTWQVKKSMRHSESNSKRKIHGNISLPQETSEISNEASKLSADYMLYMSPIGLFLTV